MKFVFLIIYLYTLTPSQFSDHSKILTETTSILNKLVNAKPDGKLSSIEEMKKQYRSISKEDIDSLIHKKQVSSKFAFNMCDNLYKLIKYFNCKGCDIKYKGIKDEKLIKSIKTIVNDTVFINLSNDYHALKLMYEDAYRKQTNPDSYKCTKCSKSSDEIANTLHETLVQSINSFTLDFIDHINNNPTKGTRMMEIKIPNEQKGCCINNETLSNDIELVKSFTIESILLSLLNKYQADNKMIKKLLKNKDKNIEKYANGIKLVNNEGHDIFMSYLIASSLDKEYFDTFDNFLDGLKQVIQFEIGKEMAEKLYKFGEEAKELQKKSHEMLNK